MRLKLIAAVNGEHLGIGIDNRLPWHIPEELKHFKNTTLGSDVIMGKNTYESIGRPLPGRDNIILANNRFRLYEEGTQVVHSIQEAIDAVNTPIGWVIGGGTVYHTFMNLVDDIVLTEIEGAYRCNRFFPRSWHWINEHFALINSIGYEGFKVHYYTRIKESE